MSGGPADVISNNVDGLLTSPENYSNEILNLFNNSNLLNKIKINARNKVLEKYSIEETSRVLLQSIESALS